MAAARNAKRGAVIILFLVPLHPEFTWKRSGSTNGCGRRASTRRAAWPREIGKGRILVNGQPNRRAKSRPATHPGAQGRPAIEVLVRAVSAARAPVARQLYEETPESAQARERAAEQRRLAPSRRWTGRRRDRRLIDRMRGK